MAQLRNIDFAGMYGVASAEMFGNGTVDQVNFSEFFEELTIRLSSAVATQIIKDAVEKIYKPMVLSFVPSGPVEKRQRSYMPDPAQSRYFDNRSLISVLKAEQVKIKRVSLGKNDNLFQVGWVDVARVNEKTKFSWLYKERMLGYSVSKRGKENKPRPMNLPYITRRLISNSILQAYEYGRTYIIKPRAKMGYEDYEHLLHPYKGFVGYDIKKNEDAHGIRMITKVIPQVAMFRKGLLKAGPPMKRYIVSRLKQYLKGSKAKTVTTRKIKISSL